MSEQELFYVLALQKVDKIGDIISKKLITACGSAEAVFTAPSKKITSIAGIGTLLLQKLRDKSIFQLAEAELNFINRNNISTFSFLCPEYPDRLKHCPDGPVLLFSRGHFNLERRKVISIVGTRKITPQGAEICRKLIHDLVPLDPVIVSGFAYGVDIVAHQAAIENKLQTIAVVAHGLNQIYPKSHKRYARTVEENGAFFTEFWSTSDPDRENFIKRNRIVAGISEATIVIESADKGGSLITANMAHGYNRDVFAVPGRPSDIYSQGCNNLIKSQKANLLTGAADLIYIMNWDLQQPVKPVQKQLFITLETDEQKIYDYLQHKGREHIDMISLECGFPIFRISPLLLNMELKGVIRPLPGKQFEIT
ncbi:MAG TPA: DNA-processing protein DprA [Flavobacterium sp.]